VHEVLFGLIVALVVLGIAAGIFDAWTKRR
jgi:hypothetical protein